MKQIIPRVLMVLLAVCGLYACASIGSPGGGDYDITPPRFTGGSPQPNSIHYTGNKITLYFDEYISIDKPSEKVIITPPQKKMPVIKAVGKKITVELKDTLLPNTTYTFDFTNAIVDNNEKNVLEGFTYAFSTGDVVDTLVISGLLLNAENLEPVPNVLVGIHSNLSDTAFLDLPFLRTSQTNETGKFWIRNVGPGSYHLFALGDLNRNFKLDPETETMAFDTVLIVPSFEPAVRQDTVWKDSLRIDTIRTIAYTRFLPDNVLLRLSKENFELQYLSKTERPNARQFTMNFNAPVTQLLSVELLDEEAKTPANWVLPEQSSDRKTITYWMTDSTIYQKDTLHIATAYLAHDTLNNLVAKADTFRLLKKKEAPPKESPKDKKKKEEKNKEDVLVITVSPSGTIDVFDTLKILFSEPPLPFAQEKIQMSLKVDTLWQDRKFHLEHDSLNPRQFFIFELFPYNIEFRLRIDSAATSSIYGKVNDSIDLRFKTRAEEDYARLFLKVSSNATSGFGQLLDGSEKIIKQSPLEEGEIDFYDIKPGTYYVRYIEDANGNGCWDAGNYAENRQPETVYYYPEAIELKAFWDLEQHWNLTQVPVEKQKPAAITKNKPKEKQQPKRDNKRNENTKNTNNTRMPGSTGTSNTMRNMPGMQRF